MWVWAKWWESTSRITASTAAVNAFASASPDVPSASPRLAASRATCMRDVIQTASGPELDDMTAETPIPGQDKDVE
jgi:hypothetical protein